MDRSLRATGLWNCRRKNSWTFQVKFLCFFSERWWYAKQGWSVSLGSGSAIWYDVSFKLCRHSWTVKNFCRDKLGALIKVRMQKVLNWISAFSFLQTWWHLIVLLSISDLQGYIMVRLSGSRTLCVRTLFVAPKISFESNQFRKSRTFSIRFKNQTFQWHVEISQLSKLTINVFVFFSFSPINWFLINKQQQAGIRTLDRLSENATLGPLVSLFLFSSGNTFGFFQAWRHRCDFCVKKNPACV